MVGCSTQYCKLVSVVIFNLVGPTPLYINGAVESAFNHRATSATGAHGVFQIMPITETHVNTQLSSIIGQKLDRKDVIDNSIIAQIYWGWLTSQKPTDAPFEWVLAAWNWGPRYARETWDRDKPNVSKWLKSLPAETQQHIRRFNEIENKCVNKK
jgi:membrane-bound lytic murein transglycosylase MltF